MATALTDLVLKVGSITGIGLEALNGNSPTPRMAGGAIAVVTDAFGYKVLKYVRVHQSTGMTIGQLASRPANVAISNITSGTTTSLVTSGLTADVHEGKMLYVLDKAATAGAAPEGETSVIASNTATAVTIERDRPFSVALAANDDLTIIATFQAEDSADGDFASYVHGVIVAADGVSDGNYGWVQTEGFCPNAAIDTDAQTADEPLVADVAALGDDTTDGVELWCAIALAAVTSDALALIMPVNLTLFSGAVGNGAP